MVNLQKRSILILAGLAITAWAQLAPPAREIPLYPGVAPGSENWNYPERVAGTPDRPQAQNIVRPVLLYYPAEKANAVGTAMIDVVTAIGIRIQAAMPDVNMWWPHTVEPMVAMPMVDMTM